MLKMASAYANLGYDYFTVYPSKFGFARKERVSKPAAHTTSLNSESFIYDRKSFGEYIWREPEDFSMEHLVEVEQYIPDGMKGVMVSTHGGVLENIIGIMAVTDRVYERISNGMDFESVAAEEPSVETIEQMLDLKRGMRDARQHPSITVAANFSLGDISGVYENYNGYAILRCERRSEVTYYDYAQIKGVICSRMAETEYDRMLAEMIEKAQVKINDHVYKQIDDVLVK